MSIDVFKLGELQDIDDFLNSEEEEYDWLIPGLIEFGDRTIITGNEGKGKTTLYRQLAIQIAAGIHPFTHEPMTPRRVMFVDLENPKRVMRRKMKEIKSDVNIKPGYLKVISLPQGLDLRNDSIRMSFTSLFQSMLPDVLIIGPIYKMWNASLENDQESLSLALYLDSLRMNCKFALFLEAHQPHSTITNTGRYMRPPRPIGSSIWVRWPEFGMCLEDSGKLTPWRGARDERDWPTKLVSHGDTWPWEIATPDIGPIFCLKCSKQIPEDFNSEKYCSKECGNSYRMMQSRLKKQGNPAQQTVTDP